MSLSRIIALIYNTVDHAVWHSSNRLIMAISQIILKICSDMLLILLHILYLNLTARIIHVHVILVLYKVLKWSLSILEPLLLLNVQIVVLEYLIWSDI